MWLLAFVYFLIYSYQHMVWQIFHLHNLEKKDKSVAFSVVEPIEIYFLTIA